MKVVVLNGSPHKKGNTAAAISELVAGAREAGNEVEVVDLAGKKVAGCLGCKYCFTHDGVCVQKDDMKEILASLDQADMMVIASPIYWFDITAQMKTVIDRLYARASVGFHFHKVALLLDSGSPNVYDAAISQYKMTNAFVHWEDMGIVTAPGMTEKGSMKDSPALKEAYELGRSLQ